MAIIVTCPGCHKSFSVSDKFAGKKGPCPKCKTIIKIPALNEQVVVHGGEAFSDGGRNAAGELVLKPIKRLQPRFSLKQALKIAAFVLVAFAIAWWFGGIFSKMLIARVVALCVITPPLVYMPYFFLRDSEAVAYIEVRELRTRTILCTISYLAMWLGFAILSYYVVGAFGSNFVSWLLAAAPFIAVGVTMGAVCYDLEMDDGILHFAFYVIVTFGLAMTAGVAFYGDEDATIAPQRSVPVQTSPAVQGNPNAAPNQAGTTGQSGTAGKKDGKKAGKKAGQDAQGGKDAAKPGETEKNAKPAKPYIPVDPRK